MTRIGLAGVGAWGVNWFDAIPDADLSVVLRKSRNTWGERSSLFTLDLAEFLDRSDLVIVATPTETHFDIVSAALQAGKRVLCEKPLAENLADVLQLYAMAEPGQLWVAYPHLWHPDVEQMARHPEAVYEVTFCGPTPREPLLDWGVHAVSMAEDLLGGDALVVGFEVSNDRTRAQVELAGTLCWSRVHCEFGASPAKRVRVAMKSPGRAFYTGEPCQPSTMQRMLKAFVDDASDARADSALTIRTHQILEEVANA